MQTITPFLWYDTEAEEAAKFYVSIKAASGWLRVESLRRTKSPED
jgi:predicted 3-demethylubiquinone-9 3-methyltransferase (glyoxalase superfamily)